MIWPLDLLNVEIILINIWRDVADDVPLAISVLRFRLAGVSIRFDSRVTPLGIQSYVEPQRLYDFANGLVDELRTGFNAFLASAVWVAL